MVKSFKGFVKEGTKIVPQPNRHVVYHDQGKGVSSSIAPHHGFDDEHTAKIHISNLKAMGDKRNLVVHSKAQFSKKVKESVAKDVESSDSPAGFKLRRAKEKDQRADHLKRVAKAAPKKESLAEENTYAAFHNGKTHTVTAKSSYEAQQKAVAHFKPKKSQAHMVHVHLAQKDGKDVVHTASESVNEVVHDKAMSNHLLSPESHKAWAEHHHKTIKQYLSFPAHPSNSEAIEHHAKELHRHTTALHKIAHPGERR